MARLVEIRDRTVVNTETPADDTLPVGTHLDKPDGYYVGIGMDVEGPFHDRADAEERISYLKRQTNVMLEDQDRHKQNQG